MYRYILADNLCKYCKIHQLNVYQLADAIGKSPRQVNRYRNGQCDISLNTLERIADVFQVSIIDLLS